MVGSAVETAVKVFLPHRQCLLASRSYRQSTPQACRQAPLTAQWVTARGANNNTRLMMDTGLLLAEQASSTEI